MCGVCVNVQVHGYAWVCGGGPGYVWKCSGVCIYTWVCTGCVWDEFSEYLLETRVLTSADFNTYPIRIFYTRVRISKECRYSVMSSQFRFTYLFHLLNTDYFFPVSILCPNIFT